MRIIAAGLVWTQFVALGAACPAPGQRSYDESCLSIEHTVQEMRTGLTPDFDAGRVSVRGDTGIPHRAFDAIQVAKPSLVATIWHPDPRPPRGSILRWPDELQAEVATQLQHFDPERHTSFEVRLTAPNGKPRRGVAPISYRAEDVPKLKTALARNSHIPRDGGLVSLTGGVLTFRTSANVLADARLDVCGTQYCLRFADAAHNPMHTGATLALPFSPSPLFTATWKLAYEQRVDALYLSINPTRASLAQDDPSSVPATRLELDPPPSRQANDIVTAGGIDGTELGPILLEADIAFKSADLGFNVLKGRRAAAPVVPESLPDPLTPSAEPAKSRFCRYAWLSSDQRLEPTLRGVALVGPPVHAMAEAERLIDGELQPYPAGGWCADAKVLARRLNAQLARGTAPAPIMKLAAVANTQNLARFVRDNSMTVTDEFLQSLVEEPARVVEPIARTTSGIRSNPQPALRLDYRADPSGVPRRVLLVYGDLPASAEAEIDTSLARIGAQARPSLKAFGTPTVDSDVVEAELMALQARLAGQLHAAILPALGPTSPIATATATATEYLYGVDQPGQSIAIHGGVLLGARKASEDTAALHTTLLDPEERPLFRATARGVLHFWSFRHPAWRESASTIGAGEHLEVRGGTVIARSADAGKLRFIIAGTSVTARRQVRFPEQMPDYPSGAEWTQSVAENGKPASTGYLTWLDEDGDFVGQTITDPADIAARHLPADQLQIGMSPLTPGLWLVEIAVPFEPLAAALDQMRATARASGASRAMEPVVTAAVLWGAHDQARSWRSETEEAVLPSTSVDTLYAMRLNDRDRFADVLSELAQEALTELNATPRTQPRARFEKLDVLEQIAEALPPERAATLHGEIVTTLKALGPQPRWVQAKLATRIARHQRGQTIANALAHGAP